MNVNLLALKCERKFKLIRGYEHFHENAEKP